jgi:hypothetical protein
MATNALLSIEEVVTRFCLKYELSLDHAVSFTEHACNCVRDFRVYDSNQVESSKVTVSALGIIEMPDDMLSFVDLCKPYNGQWVSLTEIDTIVNTTTMAGLVETRDSDFGEGEVILHPEDTGYGARGAVNSYNYTIDWEARRIFCEGITSDTLLLRYVSSGIETSGTTTVPDILTPVIDAYLLWKGSYYIQVWERKTALYKEDYKEEKQKIRNLINSMSYSQWSDLLLGLTTQAPIR